MSPIIGWVGIITFLVHYLIQRSFPVLLVENFDGDHVPLDGAVHVFTTHQKHRFLEPGNGYASLNEF